MKDPGHKRTMPSTSSNYCTYSIEDLNGQLSQTISLQTWFAKIRTFPASEEAFRHLDEEGIVSADCTKCHLLKACPSTSSHGSPCF
jgi:hypothetical protein